MQLHNERGEERKTQFGENKVEQPPAWSKPSSVRNIYKMWRLYSFSISGTTAAIVKLLRIAKLRTAFTEVPHHQMAMVMRQYVLAGSQVHDEVAS